MEHNIRKNLITLLYDLLFIMAGCICLILYKKSLCSINMVYNPILYSISIAALIILITFYPIKVENQIYKNKKTIFVFIFIAVILQTIIKLLGINYTTQNNSNRMYVLLIQLCLPLAIFICYFFKVKLKSFNWGLTFSSFTLVIIAFIAYILLFYISKGKIYTSNNFNIDFIVSYIIRFIASFVVNFISAAFFEEVLFRGFLISGLKGLGLSDNTCNAVQAILFGISHAMSWGAPSLVFLLSLAAQAMMGYVFGKLYYKTKSLLPCILFHALLDSI